MSETGGSWEALFSWMPTHQADAARDARFESFLHEQSQHFSLSSPFLSTLRCGFAAGVFAVEAISEREHVPFLRSLFFWSLQELQAEEATAQDLMLIFEEAISNSIRHSYLPEDQKWVRFEVSRDGDAIVMTLADRGTLGHKSNLGERLAAIPTQGRPPIRRGGMGLFLIKRMMDQVDFQVQEDTNLLTMRKLANPRSKS